MQEISSLLEGLGLSKGEINVYLALLRLGESTSGPIAKSARISAAKVYPVLEKLIGKGLVGFVRKGKVKHFQAASPEKLVGLLEKKRAHIEEQEAQLKRLLPSLSVPASKEAEAFLYKGIRSIKDLYEEMYRTLKKGDEYIAFGIAGSASLRRANAFFQEWQERRGKKGIRAKILYEHDARDLAMQRQKAPLTEVRVMPESFKTPAGINIYANTAAIILWTDDPVLIVIRDENTANSFREYFRMIWKMAQKA